MDGYARVLSAVAEVSHSSCLILTSREAPPELAVFGSAVRSLELHGLDTVDAQNLLADKQLYGDTHAWQRLVDWYGGNGLALKIVSETIRQVYSGNIEAFLADATASYGAVFGGTRRLLDAQVERLSPTEHDILTRLAVEREPINLVELASEMKPSFERGAVVEAIETLRRRSLVERGERAGTFTLQSMVLEYVTDRLVETVAGEIERGQPAVLIQLPLIRAQAKDYVRQAQERLIGTPILRRVGAATGVSEAEPQLLALLDRWRRRPVAEQGYGPGNVVNLLRLLRRDLRGVDLSNLALQHVYLQDAAAQDASLAGAILTQALVAEAFAYPTAVALSADGAFLAGGMPSGEVRLWSASDRTLLLTLQSHAGAVWSVAFSTDARFLASGGVDGLINVWAVPSGWRAATLRGHTAAVYGVAIAGDGRIVASAADDGTARIWSLTSLRPGDERHGMQEKASSGQLLATLEGHTGGVRAVALSADGRLAATGGLDGTIRLWETLNGHTLTTLTGHTGVVWGVALSGDGALLASGGVDGTVRLWTVTKFPRADGTRRSRAEGTRTGALRATFQAHTGGVRGVALSMDGRLAASGGVDGVVRLWDTASCQLVAALHGHTVVVYRVALSGDGHLAASASFDGTVRLWATTSRQLVATLRGHSAVVWSVAISGDGQVMAGAGHDGLVRLWHAVSGELLSTLPHAAGIRAVALSGDGQLVASGGVDGTVRVWDVRTGALVSDVQAHTGMVRGVALSWDGRVLASGGVDETVKLSLITRPSQRAGTRSPRASGAHSQIEASLEGHTGLVRGLGLSADGRLVAGGSWDQLHAGAVYGIALSDDGQVLASSGLDGVVRIWDVPHNQLLATLRGHTGAVWSVALAQDGRHVVSGGDDGTIRLWDTVSGDCLHTLRSDRRYQRLDITGLTGVTDAQRSALLDLGAIDHSADPSFAGRPA
jgi:WD40 repeat protein